MTNNSKMRKKTLFLLYFGSSGAILVPTELVALIVRLDFKAVVLGLIVVLIAAYVELVKNLVMLWDIV